MPKLDKTRPEKIREAWIRGKLDYKLHSGQRLIRSKYRASRSQLFVGECARQFGKSYLLVVEAIEQALKRPKQRIKYATAFHTDLVEFILPCFDEVLRDCPLEFRPQYKVQGSKYVFYNGSEIKLVGLDRKPNGIRGNKISGITLDEAGFMARLDYIYKSVIMPATTHTPDCRILVFSTPPETPAHEFLDYVQKAKLQGSHCKFTIYDNPMIGPDTIERLMEESGGAESTTWRREYLCEHITDANLSIIPEWKEQYVKEVDRDAYYIFYNKYVSMDLGVRDNTAIIFGYYDFLKASLIIEDEWVMNGPTLTTKMIKEEIEAKEALLWGDADPVRVSDNNNPLLIQDLEMESIYFTAVEKARLEEMVNALKMLVRSGGLIVHPRCKQLIGCLTYGVWDNHRDKFAHSKFYGHFDALAALIYLVRNIDRNTNPIPVDFGVDRGNQVFIDRGRPSDISVQLRKAFNRGN